MNRNDFIQYNNIVYSIYSKQQFDEMKNCVLKGILALIPCTFASFLTCKTSDGYKSLCSPVCYPETYTPVERLYLQLEQNDLSKWMCDESESDVFRITDLLSEEERRNNIIYQKCYLPYNLKYSVYSNLVHKGIPLGVLSLYRANDMNDFGENDMFLLKSLSKHINSRFYQEQAKTDSMEEKSKHRAIAFSSEYGLTMRELEIFLALSSEENNQTLANRLFISESTLKKHLQSLYRKTNVNRKLELIHLKDSVTNQKCF